ncbi:MAG: LOG family protein [Planctomycetes bacterium]|nr:LOG family protein [Planctomycetota bacterium]
MKSKAEYQNLAPHLRRAIDEMVALTLADRASDDGHPLRARVISEMVATALQLANDRLTMGELRLIRQSLREMRATFTMFERFRSLRKVAIFGSARTPRDHPDYTAALDFSRALAARGWMAITGAGPGIMQAGNEGPTPDHSFGLSIRLPFEDSPNPVIRDDPKLLKFRYYFTRKLAFMGNADAVAAFPGGYGTQDELFEALTLVQCGRSLVVPIVLVEGEGGNYWDRWRSFVNECMERTHWISSEDTDLFTRATSAAEAVEIISTFYLRYRSSRYVDDLLVLRLDAPLSPLQLQDLAQEFSPLIESGTMHQGDSLAGDDAPEGTPRIWFHHNRRLFGLIRRLIDRINSLPHAAA